MPEVKPYSVKTIIGSFWLSPLKEIEIQLAFNGNSCAAAIVIAVTLCISVSDSSQKPKENVIN